MDIGNKAGASVMVVIAVLVIGGAVASAVHFMGGPPAIVVQARSADGKGAAGEEGAPKRTPAPMLMQGGNVGRRAPAPMLGQGGQIGQAPP